MKATTGINPGIDLAALERYLRDSGVAVDGELQAVMLTGGRSNLTFRVTDGRSNWVLRRPPLAGSTPSAHDVGREFTITKALTGSAVPVPATVAQCNDLAVMGTPFTVVEFVPSRVLRTQQDLVDLPDSALLAAHSELLNVLVKLHAAPYLELGLVDFGRPDGYVERQVSRWRRQWDHVATRELNDIDVLYRRLADRLPAPGQSAVVHGDYRIDNVLLDPVDTGLIVAVVDWEMSTLGDPLTDLAMVCAYQHPSFDHIVGEPAASTSPRWPGINATAESYALQTGADLSEFDFYLALAYFKLAVIAEGIGSRYLAGAGEGQGFSTAVLSVPILVAAGCNALDGAL